MGGPQDRPVYFMPRENVACAGRGRLKQWVGTSQENVDGKWGRLCREPRVAAVLRVCAAEL